MEYVQKNVQKIISDVITENVTIRQDNIAIKAEIYVMLICTVKTQIHVVKKIKNVCLIIVHVVI